MKSNLALVDNDGANGASPVRGALRTSLAAETTISAEIDTLNETITRLQALAASATLAREALTNLEAQHQAAVAAWAEGGAQGPAPKRDEAAFTTAQRALSTANSEAETAEIALQSLMSKREAALLRLRSARDATGATIRQILVEEGDYVLAELTDLEKRRAALRADIAGLSGFLAPFDGPRAAKLRISLATDPLEATDAECRASQDRWGDFGNELRDNPNLIFRNPNLKD